MTPIQMVNPAAEYRVMQAELDAAVLGVLSSGRYILGPEGEALEKELAAYLGAAHAVGCNSGTDALHLPLVAAGVGPGDEVVVPAFTFFATAEAVSYTGAKPVFADVDADTFNLSVESLSKCVTAKTKAVIAVHLFGQCAALDEISKMCKDRNLVLVEDCAQAIGADYDGRRAGSWGDFGGFSFYPTKNLGAAGDAGLMTAKSAEHDKVLRSLRHHGSKQTYLHDRVGWNSRLDELQAAVLRVKLRRLDERLAERRALARSYLDALAGLPIRAHEAPESVAHAWHLFVVRPDDRTRAIAALDRASIGHAIHYACPAHRMEAYAFLGVRPGDLPVTEAACASVLSLPLYPGLDERAIPAVAGALRGAS
jgi:UDP-N-acetyl-3-dehydro-alpha-D-glucosamine 3-aminotranferase